MFSFGISDACSFKTLYSCVELDVFWVWVNYNGITHTSKLLMREYYKMFPFLN